MTKDHPDLPLEQQRNAEYLAQLNEWLARPINYGVSRNERWVNPAPNGHGKSYGVLHPLIGRVGLTKPDRDLGTSFYIGARRFAGDNQTVSWLAPVARAFYQPTNPSHGLDGDVAAIRTFTSRVDEVVDLDEEWYVEPTLSPFAGVGISVPAPTTRGTRRRLAQPALPTTSSAGTDASDITADSADGGSEAGHDSDGRAQTKETQSADEALRTRGMRASGAVLKRLGAPRTREMVSVLATLQPDQHDLVTRSADADLIVQGHPGTGKTVVAAYRAGYLITPNDPDNQEFGGGQRRVLLLGPTLGYVKHVRGLLGPFQRADAGTVKVTDLGTFMAAIVGIKSNWAGGIDGERDDLDTQALTHVKRAAELVRASVGYIGTKDAARRDLAMTYTTLVQNGLPGHPVAEDPATQAWLRKLPPFNEACRLRRYLPLLAQCRMAQKPVPAAEIFDHIIVDEAQDVSPIEWSLLEQYRHPWNSHWTLVGDQNQRRTNLSYTSWAGIIDQLDLGDESSPLQPSLMSRGYRSTNEILTFADGLLIPTLRQAGSIQAAGAPVHRIREPKSKRLYSRAAAGASDLARTHNGGTVAIITMYPNKLEEQMATDGWRRPDPDDFRTWALDGASVQIFSPERARGLEFDAVVVIEPRHYDHDNGRHGQLYTSLTRANRELAVVYHQRLPAGLRDRS